MEENLWKQDFRPQSQALWRDVLGLPMQELAFLGRWCCKVYVLQRAKEALKFQRIRAAVHTEEALQEDEDVAPNTEVKTLALL